MERIGTNDSTLIEIIATRSPQQLYQDKILFQQLYKKDLMKYIESETSAHFRKILLAMLQCQRHDMNYPINMAELQSEAQGLYQAGEGRCDFGHGSVRIPLERGGSQDSFPREEKRRGRNL